MNTNFDPSQRRLTGEKSVVAQILTVIVGLVVLTAAFMFSVVVFAVLAIVGLILWAYFWWKTRDLRQHLRERMQQQMDGTSGGPFDPAGSPSGRPAAGEVIDGEAVRVDEERNERKPPPG
ncbi:MAG: hypothetical protein ABI478_12830 [Propionivibrio sp.]